VTTAVRRLGAQLDTRLFTLEAPDDIKHVRAALATQARIEVTGKMAQPDLALVGFQSYLQARAPWDVVVPFAETLSEELGRSMPVPRILRDYQKLLSLVKAVTVLRHRQRRQDADGRWIATVDDYRVVYDLVQDLYEGSASGASSQVRAAVEAVSTLIKAKNNAMATVTVREVAKALKIGDMAAWRRVEAAVKYGWLENLEDRDRRPAKLRLGEPLPERAGLPDPDRLVLSLTPLRRSVRRPSSSNGGGPAITPVKFDPAIPGAIDGGQGR
jgi:hypothetical protein